MLLHVNGSIKSLSIKSIHLINMQNFPSSKEIHSNKPLNKGFSTKFKLKPFANGSQQVFHIIKKHIMLASYPRSQSCHHNEQNQL